MKSLQIYSLKLCILKLFPLISLKGAEELLKCFDAKQKKTLAYTVKNNFLWWPSACLKFLMQNIYLKMFCSQTVIFDLSQPSITKKVKQRKTLLMQVKTFFYIANKCIWNFQCKKCISESFILTLWCLISLKSALLVKMK